MDTRCIGAKIVALSFVGFMASGCASAIDDRIDEEVEERNQEAEAARERDQGRETADDLLK